MQGLNSQIIVYLYNWIPTHLEVTVVKYLLVISQVDGNWVDPKNSHGIGFCGFLRVVHVS